MAPASNERSASVRCIAYPVPWGQKGQWLERVETGRKKLVASSSDPRDHRPYSGTLAGRPLRNGRPRLPKVKLAPNWIRQTSMLGFFETKEFWAALIDAAATILAVWFAVVLGLRKMRDTEVSRLRIKCVTELVAYRFILTPRAVLSTEGKTAFYAALNAIPGLFGHEAAVMRLLRDFREEQADRKNAALLKLIRATAQVTRVPLTAVSDVDLEHPFAEETQAVVHPPVR